MFLFKFIFLVNIGMRQKVNHDDSDKLRLTLTIQHLFMLKSTLLVSSPFHCVEDNYEVC